MADDAIYWAKFFDDIYSARPMLTSLIVGGGLAPLTEEEAYNEALSSADEPQEVQAIRQRMKTDPRMKLFGYGSLDDKYGMFFLGVEVNVGRVYEGQ